MPTTPPPLRMLQPRPLPAGRALPGRGPAEEVAAHGGHDPWWGKLQRWCERRLTLTETGRR